MFKKKKNGLPSFSFFLPIITHNRLSKRMTIKIRVILVVLIVVPQVCLLWPRVTHASSGMLALHQRLEQLEHRFNTQVNGWRVCLGDIQGAEAIDFDDSMWETADIGYRWDIPNSVCWFRRWIKIPRQLGGLPTNGVRVALRLSIDNGGSIYVNGELKQAQFDRDGGYTVLTESASPGKRYLVAVRGINRPGWGALLKADLESSAVLEILPATSAFLEKVRFATTVLQPDGSLKNWIEGLTAVLDMLDLTSLEQGRTVPFLESVARAEEVLRIGPVAIIRRRTEARLDVLEDRVRTLAKIVRQAQTQGLDLSYQRVTLTVAENFVQFARDDLKSTSVQIVTRGMWNADWLANAVPRAVKEARDILTGRSSELSVHRYKTGPVKIRQGAFWQNDRPIFFVGVGHFGQVKRDIPVFPDYGFNIAQITISVGSVLLNEEEVNEKSINDLIAVLDRAADSNVAVDLLIEPHGWPRWVNEKYPDLACKTTNFLKYKIDHPRAKAILKRYLDVLIPRIAGHPALFSYCLFNEPAYTDASAFSHMCFRGWLAAKHGNIQTLNRHYGTDHKSFDEVPLPAGIVQTEIRGEKPTMTAEISIVAGTPQLYDWYRFNQERFGAVHQWIVDTIHTLDPNTPVHSKVMGKLFDTHLAFASGVDHEQWARATDISGNDNWSYYRSWTDHDKAITGAYASNWWRQAMYYDFQRSVAQGQPIFNSENHPIEDDRSIWVSARHIRTMYWQGAIHGQGATTTWVWERGDGPSLGNCLITRANCAHALGTIGLDLLRLSEQVVTLQQIQPEIALLVVPASIPFTEDYLDAMKRVFEGLHFLGTPIGFVTEYMAERGELERYKAIFVPQAKRIPDNLVDKIDDYVSRGGTLVVIGDSFTADEYGHARVQPRFLLPGTERDIAGLASYGQGTVVYRPAQMSVQAYQLLGEALMVDLGVQRPIRITDEKGRVVGGVEYRSTPFKGGYLLNLVSYRRHEIPVRIVASKRIQQVTNLFDGSPTGDFLELVPLEPMLLHVETVAE